MTVIKHKEQRVGVFIDTQNLYHSARNLYKMRVNFGAVLKDAVAGRALVRAVAYVITTEAGDEKNFFEAFGKSTSGKLREAVDDFVDLSENPRKYLIGAR